MGTLSFIDFFYSISLYKKHYVKIVEKKFLCSGMIYVELYINK